MSQPPNTALAKIQGPVATAMQQFMDGAGLRPDRCNLLMPVTYIDRLPVMSRLSVRAVQADPKPGAGDVYFSKVYMKQGEVAPTKVLLDKIAAAAGISWVHSKRIDDRSDPYYCEWEACGEMTGFDGQPTRFVRSRAVDLREGSTEAKPMPPAMLTQQRSRIAELCESKACNRVIRAALSLKQKYTTAEISRPFIIPKLVEDLDVSDPVVKQAVVAHRLGAERQLYGPLGGRVIDVEPAKAHEAELLEPAKEPTRSEPAVHAEPGSAAPEPEPEPPAPEPEPPANVCACNCGCQRDLSGDPAGAEWARQSHGKPLCRGCNPDSKVYDIAAHQGQLRL